MDQYERSMARARAEWRAKRAGKTSSSLWGFENWANEGTEGHHVARAKYGDQVMDGADQHAPRAYAASDGGASAGGSRSRPIPWNGTGGWPWDLPTFASASLTCFVGMVKD